MCEQVGRVACPREIKITEWTRRVKEPLGKTIYPLTQFSAAIPTKQRKFLEPEKSAQFKDAVRQFLRPKKIVRESFSPIL